MMASLLLAASPGESFAVYSISSTSFENHNASSGSKGAVRLYERPQRHMGVAKRKGFSLLSHAQLAQQGNSASSQGPLSLYDQTLSRFSDLNDQSSDIMSSDRVTEFLLPESNSALGREVPHHLDRASYNARADGGAMDVIHSAYHFFTERGSSLLIAPPVSTSSYRHLLQEHKGPGAPPDPLIYQYRNVAIDPPLILRSPQSFASAEKISIQAKPEIAPVHDDDSRQQQEDSSDQDSDKDEEEQRDKKKNKAIE